MAGCDPVNPTAVLFNQRGEPLNLSLDAFGRLRTSNPATIFDSKQLFDEQPLFFDTSTVGGGGVAYQATRSSSALSVAANNDVAIRQTRRYFNYQPGKGFLAIVTFVMTNGPAAGLTRRVGYFDADNGLFLEAAGTAVRLVRRTDTSGAAFDNVVAQADWSVDPMDGTGPSGVTLDFSTAQILYIAFEWLGVGMAEMGFIVDGVFYPAHRFLNTNALDVVYMRVSNLPVRWEIRSTGAAGALEAICTSVVAEGGQDLVGITRSAHSGISARTVNVAAPEMLVRIRLKAAQNRAPVIPKTISILATANENTLWFVTLNPTINIGGGEGAWIAVPNSAVEYNIAANTGVVNPVGTIIQSGYFSNSRNFTEVDLEQVIQLASDIPGTTRDEIVLAVQPLTGNGNYLGSITWIEPT